MWDSRPKRGGCQKTNMPFVAWQKVEVRIAKAKCVVPENIHTPPPTKVFGLNPLPPQKFPPPPLWWWLGGVKDISWNHNYISI